MLKTSVKQLNKKKAGKGYKMPKSRLDVAKENKSRKINTKKLVKRIRFGKRFKKVMLIFAGIVFVGIVIGVIVLLTTLQDISKKLPTPDKVFPEVPLATELIDRHGLDEDPSAGTVLYRLYGESNSDPVNLDDIPDEVKASFLAAEDDNFFNHNGYDAQGIIRCFFILLRRSGQCGASTITQQLIKLTTKDNSVSVDRKIREVLMAIRVEDTYSKDEILEMYLRVTSYGSNLVGIKSASEFYFYKDPERPELGGKEPQDLTLAQSAVLAAIVQNPAILSPTVSLADPETAKELLDERLTYIYDQLEQKLDLVNSQLKKDHGDMDAPDSITKEMIEAARNEDWRASLRPPIFTDKKAGHFVDYVTDQLLKRNYKNGEEPFTLNDLQTGGYKIYTTMDYQMQKVAEKYVKEAGDAYTYWGMHNAAVMTAQPSTGQILTMAGSKNFYAQSEGCDSNGANCLFNGEVNVLNTSQSPGSTNKVMGYYMAYKNGQLAPGSILPDIPVKIGEYELKNWDGQYSGQHQSAREMLRQSRNLPALHVVEMIGVENYLKTAQEWGYSTYSDTSSFGQSVILGGADVIPIEHVQAFSVFANGGDWVELDPILKIVDKDGNVIYEAKPNRKSLGDPQAVYLVNQTLFRLDTLGASITWDDREMAGKTGTSEDNRDSWVMEWSPDFVTLGWGGNNNNEPMDPLYGYPGYIVVPWVRNYMSEISGNPQFSNKTSFTRPGFVYQGGGSNDCNSSGECLGIYSDWLIQGREPKRGDFTRKKVKVCKDQTDRVARPIDDIMGLSEEREYIYYRDPVAGWQQYLDKYILEHGGVPNGGPTEPCNIDRSGGVTSGPFFKFTDVSAPSTSQLRIKGGVYSSDISGVITDLEFYLNDVAIPGCANMVSNYSSFDITCDISSFSLDNGTYSFKAGAKDNSFPEWNFHNVNNLVIPSGFGVSPNFTFTQLPESPVGKNVSRQIKVTYSGTASLDNVKLCRVKGGALQGCSSMTFLLGTYNYNWNSGNETTTYKFYVTADTTGPVISGGKLQSANSTDVQVQ